MSEAATAASIGAVADALRVPLDASQREALAAYVALLLKWNAAYNLTAVRELQAVLAQHIADCLAVVPALLQQRAAGRMLDVGSGGGLPGVVIAIALPAFDVTCVDAVGKKAAFLRQVAGALHLSNLHAEHGRVEALKARPFDVVVARAFASLADLCRLTESLLAPSGVWMAMKGRYPTEEIAALPSHVEVFHVERLDVPVLDAERCVVWMRRAAGELR